MHTDKICLRLVKQLSKFQFIRLKKLLATKLFRPQPLPDFVERPELFHKLDQGKDCQLTLVSAPAGYGKSVTVSAWLEQCTRPYAWLSLAKGDDDLSMFCQYVVAALEAAFPASCANTSGLLLGSHIPSAQRLAESLVNDLSSIEQPFVFVLEDFGFIHNQEIHRLIDMVVAYCPAKMQLVVTTRRDPSFALQTLRASGRMSEVRQVDLKFTEAEVSRFFQKSMTDTLDPTVTSALCQRVEGWAAGLRLILLSVGNFQDLEDAVREMRGSSGDVKEYLISEVLNHLPADIRKSLLKTAILNRFNADLCSRFLAGGGGGEAFLTHIVKANLFCIPLDGKKQWYRYHHLFQELLTVILERRYEKEEIDELHRTAAAWYDEHGFIEDAISHFSQAGAFTEALDALENHRHYLMNSEQWSRLAQIISILPQPHYSHYPGVLISKAFLSENRFDIGEALTVIETIEHLYTDPKTRKLFNDITIGEKEALLSMKYYFQVEPKQALEHAERAINYLPPSCSSALGFATVLCAFAHQMQGDLEEAHQLLCQSLEQAELTDPTYRGRILLAFCFIYWFSGDLMNLKLVASEYLRFAEEHQLHEARCFALYFLGITAFQQNNLEQAESFLAEGRGLCEVVNINSYAHCSFALALTYILQGKIVHAADIGEQVVQKAYQLGNADLLTTAKAFQIELGLREGRKRPAEQWLALLPSGPITPVYRMYSPYITEVKARMLTSSDAILAQARARVDELINFSVHTHHIPMLIELHSLAAVAAEKQKLNDIADEHCGNALRLGSQGRFIGVFRSVGAALIPLLRRQTRHDISPIYLEQVSRALAQPDQSDIAGASASVRDAQLSRQTANGPYSQPLSDREIEILRLLSQRLSNKEIASELCIAVNTVKRHVINIYQKLEVHNRREAVAKAAEMDLFADLT